MKEKTCSFFGHRRIYETVELRKKITETVRKLIIEEKVDRFLFGSKSLFDALCLEAVTELKETYPHIKRVYVRVEFPYIKEEYTAYLMKYYDETYFPEKIISAGKAVYVERNYEMIDNSRFCIVYYDEQNPPHKSGTKIAMDYAVERGRRIILL
ncbi:MAG: DUF1273 family protein [Clostridia bacterium]|nr:DUF1273 family protein [Clostridia bacterium]